MNSSSRRRFSVGYGRALVAAIGLAPVAWFSTPAQAAILANYSFTGGSAASTDTDLASVAANGVATDGTDEGNTSGVDVGFSGGGNDAYIRSEATGTDLTAALADDDFISFTLTPTVPGTVLNLTSITFSMGAQNLNQPTGSGDYTATGYLLSDVTGNTVIASASATAAFNNFNTVWTPAGNPSLGAAFQGLSSVTFFLRASDGSGAYDDLARFDNVVISGDVVAAVPEPLSAGLLGLGGLALLRRTRRA